MSVYIYSIRGLCIERETELINFLSLHDLRLQYPPPRID